MVLFFLSKSNPFHWASIWFPSRSKRRSVSASRRKLHYVGSFFLSESNPLRWASIRVFKVISRRRRRPIDRWCCFSFPNRTHFIGLRFGSYQGANTVPFPPHGENCTNVGSFFLFRIEPAPLGFDLLFLQQGGQAQFVPARLRIFFRFPIFTF